jgi:opacity protein-like surface antigen
MMKFNKIIFSAVLGYTISAGALAASPEWNVIEVGFSKIDIDGVDDNQHGFSIGGSFRFNDNYFIRGNYAIADDSIDGIDIDTDWAEFGVGYIYTVSGNSDLYGLVSVEHVNVDLSLGNDYDYSVDSGYGLGVHAGIKSRVTDDIELFGEIGFIDINDSNFSELSARLGANYYLTEHFSIGADYRQFDDVELINVSARYSF